MEVHKTVPDTANPCPFMTVAKCMRQDQTLKLDFNICQACTTGRIEGHLFALREHFKRIADAVDPRFNSTKRRPDIRVSGGDHGRFHG